MSSTSADDHLAPFDTDQVIALLGIYAAQAGSYTTLLWQVPALSLTAQSFLLTIALTGTNAGAARAAAAALSMVISASSYALMHDQRGHAINHGELAMRLSAKLPLHQLIDTSLEVDDGVPRSTDANTVWTWHHEGQRLTRRAGWMYAVWKGCMFLFLVVDVGIGFTVLPSAKARVIAAIALALIVLAGLLVKLASWRKDAGGGGPAGDAWSKVV